MLGSSLSSLFSAHKPETNRVSQRTVFVHILHGSQSLPPSSSARSPPSFHPAEPCIGGEESEWLNRLGSQGIVITIDISMQFKSSSQRPRKLHRVATGASSSCPSLQCCLFPTPHSDVHHDRWCNSSEIYSTNQIFVETCRTNRDNPLNSTFPADGLHCLFWLMR